MALQDFRCHRLLHLELEPQPVVLLGANGVGKTSVLEALSLLAPGSGLRRARFADMLRENGGASADAWSIRARLQAPSGPTDVVSSFVRGAWPEGRDRLRVSIDGQAARSRAALTEVAGMIWLTPEMDRLFVDSPAGRRRFLDRLVWGVDPAHAVRVGAYERAMQQRSVLLRQEQADPAWLAALEATMAEHGMAVTAARRQTAAQLSSTAEAAADGFPGAIIGTDGIVDGWLDDGPALQAEERLRAALAESRHVDAQTGGAAVGPHRSDMTVRHGDSGRPAGACSTGEQKMLLIALVLAGARLHRHERGTSPLLLLDEVIAHLDANHREAVIGAVAGLSAQAWYAGTDRAPFRPLQGTAQFVMIGAAGAARMPSSMAETSDGGAADD